MINDEISLEELIEALNEETNDHEQDQKHKANLLNSLLVKENENIEVDFDSDEIKHFIDFLPCKVIEKMLNLDSKSFNDQFLLWLKKYEDEKEKRKYLWDKISD